jgi:hypothetical protein
MIVDSHIHIGESLALNTYISPEFIVRQMEESGVDYCFIFPFPSYGEVYGSEWILEICREYKEFYPVYYVTLKFEPPPDDFVALKWHWVGGISDSASNYDTLKNEKLPDFLKKVIEMDLPIIFEEELEFTSLFVEKFEEVKLIIPHLGLLGGNPLNFLREFRDKENVYFDTSLASGSTVKIFVDEIGDDRIIYGSDIPFGRMKWEVEKIKALKIDEKSKKKILSENIRGLCGI